MNALAIDPGTTKLTIIGPAPDHVTPNGTVKKMAIFRCECGTVKKIGIAEINRKDAKRTVSCGCWREERNRSSLPPDTTVHGLSSRDGNHYLYDIWKGIRQRCLNPDSDSFSDYGGRGIRINSLFYDPAAFAAKVLAEIGERPSMAHTIDRKNNGGHYEPGNIRWATKTEQARNRRCNVSLTVDGVTRLAIEWADERGISRQAIIRRMHQGLPIEEILAVRLKPGPAASRRSR